MWKGNLIMYFLPAKDYYKKPPSVREIAVFVLTNLYISQNAPETAPWPGGQML